jgi:hypothetical protein
VGFSGFVVVLFVLVAARVAVGAETDTSVDGVGVLTGETVNGDDESEGPRNT